MTKRLGDQAFGLSDRAVEAYARGEHIPFGDVARAELQRIAATAELIEDGPGNFWRAISPRGNQYAVTTLHDDRRGHLVATNVLVRHQEREAGVLKPSVARRQAAWHLRNAPRGPIVTESGRAAPLRNGEAGNGSAGSRDSARPGIRVEDRLRAALAEAAAALDRHAEAWKAEGDRQAAADAWRVAERCRAAMEEP